MYVFSRFAEKKDRFTLIQVKYSYIAKVETLAEDWKKIRTKNNFGKTILELADESDLSLSFGEDKRCFIRRNLALRSPTQVT